MVVVPVVVNRWGLVPRLRGVQPKKAADGARRRARRAHARRRHRVVVVRARRWLLPYARGRSVLCCYYATGLFMVWARYQCVGGPQSWRNNGPRCCPKRLEGLSRCPRPANNSSTQNAGGATSPRTARSEIGPRFPGPVLEAASGARRADIWERRRSRATAGECRDAARVSPGSHKDVYYRVALSRPGVGEAPSLRHRRVGRRPRVPAPYQKLDTANYALPPGMSRCHFSVPSTPTSKRYS